MKLGFYARIGVVMAAMAIQVILALSSVYIILNHTAFPDLVITIAIVNMSAALWLAIGTKYFSDPWVTAAMIQV